uniref:DDE Tnp4 domain-containing protein n=2 Tax=Amphimedon queenslandica TaxID=400682 RepID=A0A1X7SIY3_AMPQE
EEPFQGHNIQETVEEHEISDDPAVFRIVKDLSYEVCELQAHNEFLLRDVHVADLKTENESLKRQLHSCSQYTGAIQNAYYACSTQHAASLLVSLSTAKTTKFGAELILDNDEKTQFYTGLTSYSLFQTLFKLLKPFMEKRISKKRPPLWSIKDEFFITLSKLRLGLLYKDITCRSNISESNVSKIFHKWLDIMYRELRQLIVWPDGEKLYETLPIQFKKHYFNVISIIDCFEIFIEESLSLESRSCTYSQYKKHNTLKVLISIAPTGSITFILNVWGGRVLDKVITQKSGFLDKISYDDLAIRGAYLEIPAFTRGKKQLSMAEVEKTRQLARLRIHVKRVIGLLRNKYIILHGVLPITLVKRPSDTNVATIEKVVTVAAALTNTSSSIVFK